MGCDIHAFIEYRYRDEAERPPQQWQAFQDGELSLGRAYRLFSALAGVRQSDGDAEELIPARGFPEDASWEAFRGLHFPIVDEVPEEAIDHHGVCWVLRSDLAAQGVVLRRDEFDYVRDPDAHTPSWLTHGEIRRCLAHAALPLEEVDIWFQAAVAAMEKLEEFLDTRLVFWFDN